jgi:hypothetical protein
MMRIRFNGLGFFKGDGSGSMFFFFFHKKSGWLPCLVVGCQGGIFLLGLVNEIDYAQKKI